MIGALKLTDSRKSAGVVVIGNEVLTAKVQDANTPVILAAMARHGLVVGEVAVIADELARIADVVRDFSRRFDLVVTTGGVGPTHDDCTWRGVAAAFDRPVQLHEPMWAEMQRRLGGQATAEQKRMAYLPQGAEVIVQGRMFLLHLENVFVLPGVPSMVRERVEVIAERFGGPRFALASVYFSVDEWHVVAAIDAVVAAFGDVAVGSYPIFDADDHRLRVTLEAANEAQVHAAATALIAAIGAEAHVRTDWVATESAAQPNGGSTWRR